MNTPASIVRRVGGLAALATLTLSLAACGGLSEDQKAIEALCSDWSWDPGLSAEENADALDATMDAYDYEVIPERVIREARLNCGAEHFAEYDESQGEAYAEHLEELFEPDPPQSDTSIADDLTRRGITTDDVRRLGAMADATGYGLGPGTSLSYEEAEFFAAAVLLTCDEVAAGSLTWQEAVAEDVADGAPIGDARTMNSYLRDSFCP